MLLRIIRALVLMGFCAAGAAEAAGSRVALVIGNGAYTSVSKLPNPANDASDIAASLTRLGFDVTLARDLGDTAFRRTLRDFGNKAAGADMAVLYYAGHGIEVGGINYLIPVDAELIQDTHMEDEAVTLDRVMAALESARGLKLVMLDACRNNPFAVRMKTGGAKRSIGSGLAAIEPTGGILVAYAARDGTVASDGQGRNSPFAQALLKNIEEPGLEINFLFRRVHDQVLASTGGQQKPYVYGALGSDAIYLKAPEPRPEPAPVVIPAPPPVTPSLDMAALYGEAQRIGTIEGWGAFLKACRDNPYCDLGQAARDKLLAPSKPAKPAPVAALPKAPVVRRPAPVVRVAPAPPSKINNKPPTTTWTTPEGIAAAKAENRGASRRKGGSWLDR